MHKSCGEWMITAADPALLERDYTEGLVVGERTADIEGYVASALRALRKDCPRIRPQAFVWYLRSGPLVTFYRRRKCGITVVARYVLREGSLDQFDRWTGSEEELVDQLWLGGWNSACVRRRRASAKRS